MKIDREKLKRKYNGHCAYCGVLLGDRWHADNLIPIKRNWGACSKEKPMECPENDTEENLMPACVQCNIAKGSMPLESWRSIIRGHIKSLNRQANYRVAKSFGLLTENEIEIKFYFETI